MPHVRRTFRVHLALDCLYRYNIYKFWAPGLSNFKELKEFKTSGLLKFKNQGLLKFKNPGLLNFKEFTELKNPGLLKFENPGLSNFKEFNEF